MCESMPPESWIKVLDIHSAKNWAKLLDIKCTVIGFLRSLFLLTITTYTYITSTDTRNTNNSYEEPSRHTVVLCTHRISSYQVIYIDSVRQFSSTPDSDYPPLLPPRTYSVVVRASVCSARCFKTFELGYEIFEPGYEIFEAGYEIFEAGYEIFEPGYEFSTPVLNIGTRLRNFQPPAQILKPACENCKISYRPTKSMRRNFKPGFQISWLPA